MTTTQWPPMPAVAGDEVSVIATVVTIHGRPMLLFPLAAPVGRSRGRRYRVRVGDTPATVRVVFPIGAQAAVRVPKSLHVNDEMVTVTVAALPRAAAPEMPADLAAAMHESGTSLGHLTAAQRDQILLMVDEATTTAIRGQRIAAAVAAARAASGRGHV